ncbi:hypothetical protein AQUCO_00700115v1 [Aquilegia coerulea]|uniref:SCP domain-containing protein n=1 Tax=Aquilegia coerulea TaxID=218851 RepID=A0A2G5EIJ3_AQUCA|nr:hypothetical protein AQUCO_00700115v1 [Aquilegia coerulea]
MDSFIALRAQHILVTLLALTMCITLGISSTLAASVLPPPLPPHAKAPVVSKQNAESEFLLAHNKARSAVGVGPLKWSKKLANDTSRRVRYLRKNQGCDYADTGSSEYGMNQFRVNNMDATPQAAVQAWMEEKKYYNHAKNTCAENHYCNSYQQVVWKKTTWVGCAQTECNMEHVSLTICYYDPPGNVNGQKPY